MNQRRKIDVVCPQCNQRRAVLPFNWRKRQSDLCQSCSTALRNTAATKHGDSFARLYRIWRGMMCRCGHWAGAPQAGYETVRICAAWQDYPTFAAWARENGYSERLTIDRRENDRGYEPDNCRWITMKENLRNRRDRKLNAPKVRDIRSRAASGQPLEDIAQTYGVSAHYLRYDVIPARRWDDV